MRSGLLFLLLFIISHAYAQNARLVLSNPNIRLVSSGSNAQIVLSNGNWENNASTASFVHGNGIVQSKGAAISTIGGTAQTQFYNLISDKVGSETQLANHIQVVNQANLVTGNFHLQNYTLDLLTSGNLVGEVYPNGNRAYCNDNQNGRLRTERVLVSGANNNIAGLGLDLTVSGAAPGNTVIFRGHDRQTSTAFLGAGNSIGRYYDVTPTVNSGFTYAFLFRYHDQELYGMNEANLLYYRSASYGTNSADWEEWGFNPAGPMSPGYPTVGVAVPNPASNTVSLSGINSFSRWTLSDNVNQPLPIVLGDFSATCEANTVRVKWESVSEVNNSYYVILRSKDAINWEELAQISGAGNSNQPINYEYIDENPLRQLAYYKLKQVDFNGQSETFAPKSVKCIETNTLTYRLYPNPAREYINIEFELGKNYESGALELIDMYGKLAYSQEIELTEGMNTHNIQPLPSSSATYILRIKSKGEVLIQAPFIKQKY